MRTNTRVGALIWRDGQLFVLHRFKNGTRHLIYQINLNPGTVQLGGPEAVHQNPDNQYHFE